MAALLERCGNHLLVLPIEGTLRAPVNGELSRGVQRLLERGERRILLDLAWLSDIDAEGVGELVRAYGMTHVAGGVLSIAHASRRVGQLLQVAGLLKLLSARAEEWPEMTGEPVQRRFVTTTKPSRSATDTPSTGSKTSRSSAVP